MALQGSKNDDSAHHEDLVKCNKVSVHTPSIKAASI